MRPSGSSFVLTAAVSSRLSVSQTPHSLLPASFVHVSLNVQDGKLLHQDKVALRCTGHGNPLLLGPHVFTPLFSIY